MLPVALPPVNDSRVGSIPRVETWKTAARRLFAWKLIDWNFVTSQLAFNVINPKRCYEFASYRKQTRQSYAKDDPGVFLVNIVQVLIAGLVYGLALLPASKSGFSINSLVFGFLLWPIGVFAVAAVGGATGLFYLLNWYGRSHSPAMHFTLIDQTRLVEILGRRLLRSDMTLGRRDPSSSSTKEILKSEIEWLYCFDVINNIVFVFLLFACSLQFLFLPIVLPQETSPLPMRIFGCFMSSGFYSVAAVYVVFHAALAVSVLSPLVADLSVLFFLPLAGLLVLFIVLVPLQISATSVMLKTIFGMFV